MSVNEERITEVRGPFPFGGSVSLCACGENQRAHGNICYVDVREDGKTRKRNVNGGAEEVGPWT